EDQCGAELTEEEPSEAVARDAPRGTGRAEGRQRRQTYVDQRARHQLDAERLSALSRDLERRRGRERRRKQPEHDPNSLVDVQLLQERERVVERLEQVLVVLDHLAAQVDAKPLLVDVQLVAIEHLS